MIENIYELFCEMVSRQSDAPAIIENDRTLTFDGLSEMVDEAAGKFPDGAGAIGIVMSHGAEMIASIFAALKCGAMYVPAEKDFPPGRIRYMMDEAGVDLVVTDEGIEQRGVRPAAHKAADATPAEGRTRPEVRGTGPQHDLAYVLYTSGTTGRPKGVAVTNRNVCHYVRAFANEFHPGRGDIMLQYSVCSFDIFVEEVFASLLNGAALAIPSDADKENVEALMDFVGRHRVTMMSGFPYLLEEMNRLPRIPDSLRLLISGGDVLRAHYVDRLIGQAEVYNTYGPSETTVCASYYRCRDGQVLADGTYPIGRAVKGMQIRILDADGEELPAGETGEICIFGDGVSNGYIGDHDEENRAFVTCGVKEDSGSSAPGAPTGTRMYRSGDLGYVLEDGSIAFLRRKDTQIMIGGRRVEIMEVTSRLNQCAAVKQAVVRALTDDEGLSYMVAYIVAEAGGAESTAEGDGAESTAEPGADPRIDPIRRELAENLTDFMIPEYFVFLPEIPLNANGKPDLTRLPLVKKEARYAMNLEIRKAGTDEIDTLMAWRMRVLREVFAGAAYDENELYANNKAYYTEHLSDGTHTACFAVNADSGGIIGCGGICYQTEMPSPDNPAGTNGYLMNIYAVPEMRGRSVGRRIVEYLLADAKARGTGKIYLESAKSAKNLYSEIGFTDMVDYMKM